LEDKYNMSKRIALLLILFMVGSWCVFADDYDYYSGDDDLTWLWILLGVAGAISIIGVIIAVANDDYDSAQYIIDAWAKGNPEKENPALTAIKENPILKHTELGYSKDNKTFVGFRFSW
jgi:hypothetical protein